MNNFKLIVRCFLVLGLLGLSGNLWALLTLSVSSSGFGKTEPNRNNIYLGSIRLTGSAGAASRTVMGAVVVSDSGTINATTGLTNVCMRYSTTFPPTGAEPLWPGSTCGNFNGAQQISFTTSPNYIVTAGVDTFVHFYGDVTALANYGETIKLGITTMGLQSGGNATPLPTYVTNDTLIDQSLLWIHFPMNSVNNMNDIGPNALGGAAQNGASLGPDRHMSGSNAYYLTGTPQHLHSANHAALNMQRAMSMGGWVYINPVFDNDMKAMTKQDPGAFAGYGFGINNGNSASGEFGSGAASYIGVNTGANLSAGRWHHVMFTYLVGGQAAAYLDGK